MISTDSPNTPAQASALDSFIRKQVLAKMQRLRGGHLKLIEAAEAQAAAGTRILAERQDPLR
jgi:hypothetical protein